jgi:hypothetical protein
MKRARLQMPILFLLSVLRLVSYIAIMEKNTISDMPAARLARAEQNRGMSTCAQLL